MARENNPFGDIPTWVWALAGGGVLVALWYYNRQAVSNYSAALTQDIALPDFTELGNELSNLAVSGVDTVTAAVSGWRNVGQGPRWLPVLNAAEDAYGIPRDLLARIAYQESRFRQSIIDGTQASPAGALGLMQLMPQYFTTVQVPRPFSDTDTQAQIGEGAHQLVNLYNHYQDWGLALAGYNDGQGNVDAYVAGTRALPQETLNYVSGVLADVPLNGATVPA